MAKALVVTQEGVRVVDLAELDRLDVSGDATVAIIEGEVVAVGRLSFLRPARQAQQPQQAAQPQEAQRPAPQGATVVVLDQMFRGFADIILRDAGGVEVHEVVGRGVQSTVAAGEGRYLEPANDDYDVLRLVERLAGRGGRVLFFTGDKRLASQAMLLASRLGNVEVYYMPPNEYPGKESLAQAMVAAIRRQGGAKG